MKKLIALFIASLMLLIIGCNQDNQPNISKEKARNFANELYNRQLFKQSAEEYARTCNAINWMTKNRQISVIQSVIFILNG